MAEPLETSSNAPTIVRIRTLLSDLITNLNEIAKLSSSHHAVQVKLADIKQRLSQEVNNSNSAHLKPKPEDKSKFLQLSGEWAEHYHQRINSGPDAEGQAYTQVIREAVEPLFHEFLDLTRGKGSDLSTHTLVKKPAKLSMEDTSDTSPVQSYGSVIEVLDASMTNNATATPGTIDYEEVYQSGHARTKYTIINCKHTTVREPALTGDWWILRCDEHDLDFIDTGATKPMDRALCHLTSTLHCGGNDRAAVIEEFGILVRNCTKEGAAWNNLAVRRATRAGYMPKRRLGRVKVTRQDKGPAAKSTIAHVTVPNNKLRQRGRQGNAHSSAAFLSRSRMSGITEPVVGQTYLAYWRESREWYGAVVLPLGDFSEIGCEGDIYSCGLLDYIPACYEYDDELSVFCGWSEGYEDGEDLVWQRKFPVLYFDDLDIRDCQTGWVAANDLKELNMDEVPKKFKDIVLQYMHYEKVTTQDAGSPKEEDSASIGHDSEDVEMYDTPECRVWSDDELPPDRGPTPVTQSPECEAQPGRSQSRCIEKGEKGHPCDSSSLNRPNGAEHAFKIIPIESKASIETAQTGQVTPVDTPGSFNTHFVIDLTGDDSSH